MANNFTVTLDTTGPASPALTYGPYATSQIVTLTISTADGTTTGYQMKLWGDVDIAYNASIQGTEVASSWISYATSQQVKLSTGDGNKTVNVKLRDDVLNESAITNDVITLDTTKPVVSIPIGPDVTKVSKQAGKDTLSFSFQADTAVFAWKIKVVTSAGAAESTGVQIPTTGGSTNVSNGNGSAQVLAAATNQAVTIKAADLETASPGDGSKIVKVFTQDQAGNWSV